MSIKHILCYTIKKYTKKNRIPPSLKEIAVFDGTSRQTVSQKLKPLVFLGYLTQPRAGHFVVTNKRIAVHN